MNQLRLYAKFEKVDQVQRMVYGYASTEALDSHGEIVRKDAIAAALPDFMRWGNIREMHQASAVGKAKEAAMDEHGLWLGAKIVDDEAWEKVKEGVYSGFSIAGTVTARDSEAPNVITGCLLSEISLVDRPANPEAVFTMFKAAGDPSADERDDTDLVQAIHDQAVELGAACPGHDGTAALARLEDNIAALDAEWRRIAGRLDALAATPAPARGAVRAIAKSEDSGAVPPANVHDLIKASLKQPFAL
jgi:phage head maturation protease